MSSIGNKLAKLEKMAIKGFRQEYKYNTGASTYC